MQKSVELTGIYFDVNCCRRPSEWKGSTLLGVLRSFLSVRAQLARAEIQISEYLFICVLFAICCEGIHYFTIDCRVALAVF